MTERSETTVEIAIARCRAQMEDNREFDDDDASFRVGDVRALLDEIAMLRERVFDLEDQWRAQQYAE